MASSVTCACGFQSLSNIAMVRHKSTCPAVRQWDEPSIKISLRHVQPCQAVIDAQSDEPVETGDAKQRHEHVTNEMIVAKVMGT